MGCSVGKEGGGGGIEKEVQGKGLRYRSARLRARRGHRKLSLPGSHSHPDRGGHVETWLNAQVLQAEAVLQSPPQRPLSDSVCPSIKWDDNLDRLLVHVRLTGVPRVKQRDAWGRGPDRTPRVIAASGSLTLWTLPRSISRASVSLLPSGQSGFWKQGWPCPFIPRM